MCDVFILIGRSGRFFTEGGPALARLWFDIVAEAESGTRFVGQLDHAPGSALNQRSESGRSVFETEVLAPHGKPGKRGTMGLLATGTSEKKSCQHQKMKNTTCAYSGFKPR